MSSHASGPEPSPRGTLAIAVACFFLSGVAALLYEVVWTRLLGLVFGHTVHAITTVLATYMGGLALGSVLIGRRADRMARPLRVYGFLEGAVGAYCLASPLLFAVADRLYVVAARALEPGAVGSTVLHLLLSAALLLPPTTLMGATLPILSRAVVGTDRDAASTVGALYSVNTWGAVVGTVVTGFLLVPALGLTATMGLGVALNVIVMLLALAADRGLARRTSPTAPEVNVSVVSRNEPAPTRVHVRVALVAIGASGAASMAYEIAWTRTISLVLGSSTYAFSAMLATFLVGLALGAAVVSRLVRHRRPGLLAFGFVEIAIALVVVALLPGFGHLPEAVLAVLRHTGVTHGAVLGTQFLASFVVMIVPTLLIGASFPLALAATEQGMERIGRDVGALYGANTIGTIAGSVLAGFVLVRTIGIQNTILAAAAVNLSAGLLLVLIAPGAGRRARTVAAGLSAGFATLAALVPHWDARVMTSGVAIYASMFLGGGKDSVRSFAAGRELLFYDEGISTTVAVTRDPGATVLTVNGKGDASNDTDMATQLMLGHLGALLAPSAKRALIVGLASGVTAGAVAQHPLERIDVAELEPAMREASRSFLAENRGVLADPRVRVIEGDGRSILLTAKSPYDLIVSEPSNPLLAGVASLFTLDFYRAARERLAPDGVFVQWLQNYSIFTDDLRMVVRTFQEVFPHVSIWTASPNDYLLVATAHPVQLDLDLVSRRLASSATLREDFARRAWTGGALAYRFFLGEEDARRFSAGAALNTDDRPLLEFNAPLALYAASPDRSEATMRSFRTVEWPAVTGADPALLVGPGGHLRAAQAAWITGHIGEAWHQLERAGPPASLPADLHVQAGRMRFLLGDFTGARTAISPARSSATADPTASRYLRALDALQEPGIRARLDRDILTRGAGSELRKVLADVLLDLARQRRDRDLYALAVEQLDAELVVRPGSYQTANNYAGVLYETGDRAGAIAALRRAVSLHPALAETRFNLGLLLEEEGQIAAATEEYEHAARLAPGWVKPRNRLTSLNRSRAPP